MQKDLTQQSFSPCLNDTFELRLESSSLDLQLVEVIDRAPHTWTESENRRRPFSLEFRGPGEPVLAQRMYRLIHEDWGNLDLFLVPVGPDREGSMIYEAVFN